MHIYCHWHYWYLRGGWLVSGNIHRHSTLLPLIPDKYHGHVVSVCVRSYCSQYMVSAWSASVVSTWCMWSVRDCDSPTLMLLSYMVHTMVMLCFRCEVIVGSVSWLTDAHPPLLVGQRVSLGGRGRRRLHARLLGATGAAAIAATTHNIIDVYRPYIINIGT